MDLQEAFDAGFDAIKGYVDRSFDAFEARFSALEARQADEIARAVKAAIEALPLPKDGRDGIDGKDGAPGLNGKDGADGLPGRDGRDGIDGKDGAPGLNGKDGADGLPGKDGRDGIDGKDGAPGLNGKDGADGLPGKDGRDGIDGKDGRDGIDGKDGAPGLNGKDGADGLPGKDGRDGIDGKDGAPGLNGKDGADGVGFSDVLVDQKGDLVVTLTNGTVKTAGHVMGPPGFSGDDFDCGLMADGRTAELSFTRGHMREVFELGFPIPIWRGIYKDGQAYEKYDEVTWAGSVWQCEADTTERPGDGSKVWKLKVKKGRDGKDFVGLQPREPGPVKI